jgi:hypothetical protein
VTYLPPTRAKLKMGKVLQLAAGHPNAVTFVLDGHVSKAYHVKIQLKNYADFEAESQSGNN